MPDEGAHTSTQITGSQINAPVTTGDNNQITVYHVEEGAIVHVHAPEAKPKIEPLPVPRDLRAQPFAGLQGREAEVAAATAALSAGRVVELFGPAGIGKSALLRFLQYQPIAERFPDGIIHLFQGALPVLDQLQALYDAFFTSDIPYRPTESVARQALREKRALILVDDAERSRPELEQVRGWMPAATFIFASLERRLFGEGEAIALAGLPNQAALALFERELGRPLTATEWRSATALCEALQGHPLYLKEAAAKVQAGTALADLVGQVTPKPDWGALLALSDPALMRLLERTEEAKRLLDQLRAADPAEPDWLSATKRVLAAQQALLLAGKPERTDDRALLLFISVGLAKDAGLWPQLLALVRSASAFLLASGRWATAQSVVEMAMTAATKLGDEASEGWALHQMGACALCTGQMERARSFLTQAEAIRQRLGDEAGLKVTRQNLQSLQAMTVTTSPAPVGRPRPQWGRVMQTVSLLAVTAAAGVVIGTRWQAEPLRSPAPAAKALLTVELAELDFGLSDQRAPVERSLRLRNQGEATAAIASLQLASGKAFRLTNQGDCAKLQPGQGCTLQLQFAPPGAGRQTDALTIAYNGDQRLDLALTGVGREVPVEPKGKADLVVTEFVPVGRTGARVTIQNVGTAPAPIFKVALFLAQSQTGTAVSTGTREFLIPFSTEGQEAQPTPFTKSPLGPGERIILQGLVPTGISGDLMIEVDSCYAEVPSPSCRVPELDESNNRRLINQG